ncbi:unnamed protein product [Strongylus vulgaris]|uniref:Uncharacterized protein n=1 Tax=Strongylus vulgaris TaxID=40348 RepID=A0A3P7JNL1_STRVU|nr:unnamed protein product [Strongylus vulgaris]
MAVRRGDHERVQQMIQSEENFIDVVSLTGQSPLVFAARLAHADLECISVLVKAIDEIRRGHHDGFLSENIDDIEANRYFRRNLLRMFPLYDEADIKYALTDEMGRNAMHYAALYNAPHLVNYFASCGANMNLIDINGDAPIHLAAKNGNFEALVALIRSNCDVNIKNGSGEGFTNFLYYCSLDACATNPGRSRNRLLFTVVAMCNERTEPPPASHTAGASSSPPMCCHSDGLLIALLL